MHLRQCLWIVLLLCFMSYDVVAGGKKTQLFTDLSPGLNVYRYDWDAETCAIYVAEMSRNEATLKFEVALATAQVLGKETVRSIAKRRSERGDRSVVVAVNGGFGVLGDIRGYGGVLESLHIQDGELITQPTDTDACFGVTESGEYLSTPVQMQANIQIGTDTLDIGSINQRRLDGFKVILYTPRLGESTRTNRRRGKEVLLNGISLPLTPDSTHDFKVETVSTNGNSKIPKNGSVLWISTQAKDPSVSQLKPGASGKLKVILSPPEWGQVQHAIGGRLRLLRDGKINQMLVEKQQQEKKHVPGKRSQELHLSHEPRTALGYNDDTLFLVVADGRQPKYSTGLTLYELSSILIELGATEAINLDGGSSSTFVVNGEVINKPSGRSEREVLNAVLITKEMIQN